ncbi:MAG: hypothetical protein M3122_09225, partial [Actinomycetota bacterium]|nr:hypothetical protein [Actinomycetota bacterium]
SRAKRGGDPKLELELTFMKLARDYTEPSIDVLMSRLETLENALASGGAAIVPPPRTEGAGSPAAKQAAVVPLHARERDSGTAKQATPAEAAAPEATRHARGDLEDGEPEEGGLEHSPERGDGRDRTVRTVAAQWEQVMQDLKDRKQALTAAYLKEGGARPVGFEGGVLRVAFSQEQDFYLREVDKPQHREALGKVLEERLGARPRLEFHVAGMDGPTVTEVSAASANNSAMPVREQPPSPDVVEVDTEEAPWPEEAPQEAEGRDAGTVPEREVGPGAAGSGGEEEEADSIIQDPREVLAIALDLFGPAGGLTRDKRNEGG